jgi:hypothetical protein
MSSFRALALVIVAVGASMSLAQDEGTVGPGAAAFDLTAYYAGAESTGLFTAEAASACGSAVGSCCDCPRWSIQAGAILQNTLTGDALLDVRDLSDPWGAGPDISIRRWLATGDSLDIRFFAVDSFHSQSRVTTPGIWNFPTNPPLFGLGVADLDVAYSTRLYSTEMNWNRPVSDWFSWLVGFRWIELYDDLGLSANFGGNTADIHFQAANRLYGGQAGAALTLVNRGAARIDSVMKAGLYGNAASNRFTVAQVIGPAFGTGDSSGQVAFAGEIGIVGVYQWTDHIALRGGYQLLWLDGVALAPDQVAATQILSADGIDTTGDAFYHGALLGVDVTW